MLNCWMSINFNKASGESTGEKSSVDRCFLMILHQIPVRKCPTGHCSNWNQKDCGDRVGSTEWPHPKSSWLWSKWSSKNKGTSEIQKSNYKSHQIPSNTIPVPPLWKYPFVVSGILCCHEWTSEGSSLDGQNRTHAMCSPMGEIETGYIP